MMEVKKIGPWTKVGKLLAAAPRRMQAAFDKALWQEGQFLRTKIVEGPANGQSWTAVAMGLRPRSVRGVRAQVH